MGGMFLGCENLEEVNLSGWYVSAIPSRGEYAFAKLFEGCSKLKKVNLSGWNMPAWTNQAVMTSMFKGCTSLTREGVITDGCSEHTIKIIDEYFANL